MTEHDEVPGMWESGRDAREALTFALAFAAFCFSLVGIVLAMIALFR